MVGMVGVLDAATTTRHLSPPSSGQDGTGHRIDLVSP
jgi:hypothetical protein